MDNYNRLNRAIQNILLKNHITNPTQPINPRLIAAALA